MNKLRFEYDDRLLSCGPVDSSDRLRVVTRFDRSHAYR
jgi:hypothetical protein